MKLPAAVLTRAQSFRSTFASNPRIWLGFVFSICLILLTGLVAERLSASVHNANQELAHSHRVLDLVESIADDLSSLNAEVLRHVSLAGLPTVSNFIPLLDKASAKWVDLETMVQEDSDERRAIDGFRAVVEARKTLLASALRQPAEAGAAGLDPVALLNLGHPNMYEFRRSVDQVQAVERQRLRRVAGQEDVAAAKASATILGSSVLAALLLALSGDWLFRERQRSARAEEAKRQSDLRLNLALNAAAVGTWTWDIKHQRRFWDEQTYRLFGQAPGTLAGNLDDLLVLVHPEDRNRVWQGLLAAMSGRQEYNTTYRIIRPDGQVRHLEVRGRAEPGPNGEPNALMGTCVDVTERVRAEEELRRSLLEKEVLLREVHHRVKNNLQVIDSLLQMQAGAASDPGSVKILAECQSRVRSMALIHQKLYQSGDFAHVNLGEYIGELAAFLFRNYAVGQRVRFDSRLVAAWVPLDTAIPLGLILNELITNSLKYAFPDRREGLVRIETVQEADGTLCLRYQDNGVGLPTGFELGKSQSMGFRLVRLLARQIRAQLDLAGHDGVAVGLRFPASSAKSRA